MFYKSLLIALECLESQGPQDSRLEVEEIYFYPSPKDEKPRNNDWLKRDLKVSFPYMRLFESANQFLLSLVRPNLATWDVLNSQKAFTWKSHWTGRHLLYLVCFKRGGYQLHTAYFLARYNFPTLHSTALHGIHAFNLHNKRNCRTAFLPS